MTEAQEGADGEALATMFAEEVDAILSPLLGCAEQVLRGGPFALRRAIELAKRLISDAAASRERHQDHEAVGIAADVVSAPPTSTSTTTSRR